MLSVCIQHNKNCLVGILGYDDNANITPHQKCENNSTDDKPMLRLRMMPSYITTTVGSLAIISCTVYMEFIW